ncbi:MAG: uroporphyrinogen-III C-methyltransferase [Thermodesulfobacteriota bacterium]
MGKVYLVGAGPGDPGLITVRGLECIRKAETLIYDYLASPSLLDAAPGGCERIYVGKKGGDHTLPQKEINALILKKAREGKIVTRLKGGDPFIFGRGGEEAEVLAEAGIPFEIVPGVSSAVAAPAYAGIPLTHREFTSTVGFVTGHEDPTKDESSIDWKALARGMGTLVFLMGVKNLPRIVSKLMENGLSGKTPIALIQWGTTPGQVTVSGTLETIEGIARKNRIGAPAIICIGGVVSLREKLNWFESKPLFGKRILVTRAREQASDLVRALSELGGQCLEIPTIRIAPPEDKTLLEDAVARLNEYHWIIFTSVNGVSAFFNELFLNGKDARALGSIKTAVIGPATQKRLLDYGIKSDILPESYRAESIIAAFSHENINGKKILIPRAKEARMILPAELQKLGGAVHEVAAYRTISSGETPEFLVRHLKEKKIDLITFTSSSTVKNFKDLLSQADLDSLIKNVTIASIGPITTETAQRLGFTVQITADTFTIPGLVDAICRYYRNK